MRKQFVPDSNLPVSDNVSKNDPNHPNNVMKNAAIISDQASADTAYDIIPPPREERKESFENPSDSTRKLIGSILAIVFSLLILFRVKNTPIRVLCIGVLIYSIHFLLQRLENRTV